MTKDEFKTLKRGDVISNKYETHKGSVCGYDYLVDSDYIWDEVKQDGYIECHIMLTINGLPYIPQHFESRKFFENDIEKCLNMHIKVHGL